jgi:hypothetical protein
MHNADTPASTGNFWSRAMQSQPQSQEHEPPAITADDVDLADWAERRGELGIRDNGEFIGVNAWKRPTRYIHHEETELEKYAAQRRELGIKDAPQSSVDNPRKNAHPFGTAAHTIRKES